MEIKLLIDKEGKPYLSLNRGSQLKEEEADNYTINKFMKAANKEGVRYEMHSPYHGYIKLDLSTDINNIEELTKKVCKIIKDNPCMLGHNYPNDFNDVGQKDMRDLTKNLSKLFKKENNAI